MTVVLKEQNRVAEHIESNLCSSLANLGHIYLRSRDEGSTSRCPKTNRSVPKSTAPVVHVRRLNAHQPKIPANC